MFPDRNINRLGHRILRKDIKKIASCVCRNTELFVPAV